MATRYEYYNTGEVYNEQIYADIWCAQTFTPLIAHTINCVKLLLGKIGALGTITISIRATDIDGHPAGADLCLGTTDGSTLPEEGKEWRTIAFSSGYALLASTKYAIVVRALDAVGDRLLWWYDPLDATYPRGWFIESGDGGVTWFYDDPDSDFLFEEWEGITLGYSQAHIIG
jgi:hypothetical protein